ncbi:MAG: tRNA epoxyqueuosine(34) reductase QueG [Sorangiineae bacterium]|nr:tRNA epoxyqueuosine(34) reductase QueG [Polyangiaceae bacterium]MEB2323689.1 tRNA epoxyqueuosine(34) reductase QueG [Sorangiineae bacterium]
MSGKDAGFEGDPSPDLLAARIAEAALGLGFTQVGFAPATRLEAGAARLERWLAAGFHGAMSFLERDDRADPTRLLPEARSIIVVALGYGKPPPAGRLPLRRGDGGAPWFGTIASYARGEDYHLVVKEKLHRLAERCSEIAGRPVRSRACTDSAPLLEGEAAARAGIGFVGKNTLVITPGSGSFFLLGELLVDLEITPGEPVRPGCGSCRACLDACPTGALLDGQLIDARRCISYLTIELTGAIPRELRPLIGTHVYGCDICQVVCPYNSKESAGARAPEFEPRPALDPPELVALLELGAAGYRKLVKRTALRRSNRYTLARNAAVALGNTGAPGAVAPLARALANHPSALVRGHAAWALGRLGGAEARAALEAGLERERDAEVREELALALDELARSAARGAPGLRAPRAGTPESG